MGRPAQPGRRLAALHRGVVGPGTASVSGIAGCGAKAPRRRAKRARPRPRASRIRGYEPRSTPHPLRHQDRLRRRPSMSEYTPPSTDTFRSQQRSYVVVIILDDGLPGQARQRRGGLGWPRRRGNGNRSRLYGRRPRGEPESANMRQSALLQKSRNTERDAARRARRAINADGRCPGRAGNPRSRRRTRAAAT